MRDLLITKCSKCGIRITSKIASYCSGCGFWFPSEPKPNPHFYMDQEGGIYDKEIGMYVK